LIVRSSRLLLEVLAALVAGFVILVAVVAWRLGQDEPLRLQFLTPYLEQALTPPDRSFTVEIDHTSLTWAGWERTIDLRAGGVRIVEAGGKTVAAVPELALTLSARAALLHGLIAPTSIEIFGPRLSLLRNESGHFIFVHTPDTEAEPVGETASPVIATLLQSLLAPPDSTLPTGYLRRASITNAQLTFIDRANSQVWRAPEATIRLMRDERGITGSVALAIEGIGQPARLDADLDYDSAGETLAVTGRFTGVEAGELGRIEPGLRFLAPTRLTLGGRLTTSIQLDGRIGDTRFDLEGGSGRLELPGELEAPLPIARAAVQGRFDSEGDRLVVDNATVELDGPRLTASGTFTNLRAALSPNPSDMLFAVHLVANGVPMDRLSRYWPSNAGKNARDWVTANVSAGTVDPITADIGLRIPGGDFDQTLIERFEGTMIGKDLTIHYLPPMPPMEGVDGTAHFTHQTFTVDVKAGHVGSIAVDGGQLVISDLDKPDQLIEMEGNLQGPLRSAIELLDHPRLGYAKRLGFAPADMAGDAKATLSFAFPASRDLTFDEVKIKATADLTNTTVAKVALGQDLTEAALKLNLDENGMTVTGGGKLAGAPLDLTWEEDFGSGKFIRRIAATGTLDAAQRAALGFDFLPTIDGPVGTDLVYTLLPKKRATVDLKLALAGATLDVSSFGWRKEAGVMGAASFRVELLDDRPLAIPEFTIAAGDLSVRGRARFAEEGGALQRVEFDELHAGRSDLRGVVADFTGGAPDVVLGSGDFDATPLLKNDEKKKPEDEKPQPAFSLRAERLGKVYLGEDRALSNVSVSLRHDGAYWDRVVVDATLPEGQPLAVRYQPDAGKHKLSVTSGDAGGVLRAFDILDNVKGGALNVVGEAVDSAPGRPLVGQAVINDFRLVQAPVLARLLTLATLTGFVDALTGEGFQFNQFKSDFTKTGGRLDIKLARAHGPSIGLTGTGNADFDKNTVDISGTVVPAYALNSILGNIPVIGDLLQGGKGEGMFAATYHASGSLDEPRITVNPLAALTPGFLRGLFDIFSGSGDSGAGDDGAVPNAPAAPPGSSK
jgi:hypothetical protein